MITEFGMRSGLLNDFETHVKTLMRFVVKSSLFG